MNNAEAVLRSVRLRDGYIDFARLKLAGNTQQKKNCSKGWPCGFTCLSRSKKNCKKALEGQAADLQKWTRKERKAKKDAGGGGTSSTGTGGDRQSGNAPRDALTGLTRDRFNDSTGAAMDEIRADAAKRLGVERYDVKELGMSPDDGQMFIGLRGGEYKAINLKDETPEQALKALESDSQMKEFLSLLSSRASNKKIMEALDIGEDDALRLSAMARARLGVGMNQTVRDRLKELRGKKK